MRKPLPDQDELHRLLILDKKGRLRFRWRPISAFPGEGTRQAHSAAKWNTRYAGTYADTEITKTGHRRVSLWNSRYSAHRIVWKMVHGTDPDIVDHRKGIGSDNRPKYLRDGDTSANMRNAKRWANNTSGTTGVHWCNTKQRWIASVVDQSGKRRKASCRTKRAAIAKRRELQRDQGYTRRHGK